MSVSRKSGLSRKAGSSASFGGVSVDDDALAQVPKDRHELVQIVVQRNVLGALVLLYLGLDLFKNN